jgi:anion-transporting  ArsA/GET3 family ATPase
MNSVQDFIDKAIQNIVEDRAATKTLLMNLMKYMQTSDDRHREVGLVAAKYVETLQRSNEQLVKLANMLHKKKSQDESITDKDKQDLFDLISDDAEDQNE